MLPGKIRGAGNELPGVPRSQRPDPEQLFPIPAGKVPIFKRRSCCSEFELHTQQPDVIITRTILRFNPDPDAGDDKARSRPPNIPNIFPLGSARPPPLGNPAILLGSRYLLLLGFVRLLWDFLLV